mgnify:CR=1 FL=1
MLFLNHIMMMYPKKEYSYQIQLNITCNKKCSTHNASHYPMTSFPHKKTINLCKHIYYIFTVTKITLLTK